MNTPSITTALGVDVPVDRRAALTRDGLGARAWPEIRRIGGVRLDPTKIGRMRLGLARNESTSATVATIAADNGGGDTVRNPTPSLPDPRAAGILGA